MGASLVEADRVEMARDLMERAGDRLVLPVDCRVADRIATDARPRIVARDAVGGTDLVADIGPETEGLFAGFVREARTILWNGPMGVFEAEPFAQGTLALALAVAEATDRGAVSVLGGGDSAAAAEAAGVTPRLSHVSTGGGASLEFLAGAELPGVAALSDEENS
jgi:phosphoglycerate kinase